MKLGYTIIYVPDVEASLQFFERAFGLKRRFLHESGTYGELETGETTLSFAAHALGDSNFPGGHVHAPRQHSRLAWRSRWSRPTLRAPTKAQLPAGRGSSQRRPLSLGGKSSHTCDLRTVASSSCAHPCRFERSVRPLRYSVSITTNGPRPMHKRVPRDRWSTQRRFHTL